MTLVEMQVKWSVTLTDRLGPEILTVLEIKGQVLHREVTFSDDLLAVVDIVLDEAP